MKEYPREEVGSSKPSKAMTSGESAFIGVIFVLGFVIPVGDNAPWFVVWIQRIFLLIGIAALLRAALGRWIRTTLESIDSSA